jgi:hypothetical protein
VPGGSRLAQRRRVLFEGRRAVDKWLFANAVKLEANGWASQTILDAAFSSEDGNAHWRKRIQEREEVE